MEQEEFARHKAYKFHRALFKIKGHNSNVNETDFFRSYVFAKANTATDLVIHSKERMWEVDSGTSSQMME